MCYLSIDLYFHQLWKIFILILLVQGRGTFLSAEGLLDIYNVIYRNDHAGRQQALKYVCVCSVR